jgi:RimJ/RimL family protein N-acetyltransferase
MPETYILSVREIELKDIALICDYWFGSDSSYLVAMGVDLNKMPSKQQLEEVLSKQILAFYTEKESYTLIWEMNGEQIGHSNINKIEFGRKAAFHLHIWSEENRNKGLGSKLVRMSLPFYFENFQLEQLYCEPYALNPAPNNVLPKLGFHHDETLLAIPGAINFEQEVHRWILNKNDFKQMKAE